jgi:predicted 2-oxoglutarate/Fe(II)-dependent dioxygenase YbiX/peroxiredoxin
MAIAPYVIGDWVGDFALLSVAGKQVKLSDTVGVPVVLLLCGDDPTQAAAAGAACASLAREYPTLAALNATVLAFGPGMAATAGSDRLGGPDELSPQGGGNAVWPRGVDLPFSMLIDADGEVAARYGAQRWRAVLLSPNGRVAKYYDAVDPDLLGEIVLADVAAMVNLEPARQILQQAPILLIPDVIPPEFCRKLIEVWEKQGNQDSGFMVNEEDKTVGKYDYSAKIRRDHFIPRGNELDKEARGWMGRHVAGEVFKAFNYEVTRLEDMKIACYDAARGGYFRPHRDNTTGATAHRRYAASVLLNDDYEGGYLRLPEYGPHVYRPKAGGAAIFGCSLLHEATDVTAGRRFVLLTFLYGEKEAKMREEYARRTGGGYRASV